MASRLGLPDRGHEVQGPHVLRQADLLRRDDLGPPRRCTRTRQRVVVRNRRRGQPLLAQSVLPRLELLFRNDPVPVRVQGIEGRLLLSSQLSCRVRLLILLGKERRLHDEDNEGHQKDRGAPVVDHKFVRSPVARLRLTVVSLEQAMLLGPQRSRPPPLRGRSGAVQQRASCIEQRVEAVRAQVAKGRLGTQVHYACTLR
mmetsp:Transcript_5118/g.13876  ORF Transcript_5118/g.13876 Transcript_5118/m.13876 type:complete len:200 (-) Transcript_5118:118-717(-)